ncbi:MAG: cupin domain-containing protein [Bdellovibrionales bacterium]|nr:cupin domain-containing protein [Bdellovibrionales bacterium]
MKEEINDLVQLLNLSPHPEGGFYAETYRSSLVLSELPSFSGPRSCSTGIYFLLTQESRSHLHKIQSDEMWHFYKGDPLRIVMLSPEGVYSEKVLGPNLFYNEVFQFVVPKGYWFGAEVVEGGEYSLVGCTVSPGFDFSDFELATKDVLTSRFPDHKECIEKFCLK